MIPSSVEKVLGTTVVRSVIFIVDDCKDGELDSGVHDCLGI